MRRHKCLSTAFWVSFLGLLFVGQIAVSAERPSAERKFSSSQLFGSFKLMLSTLPKLSKDDLEKELKGDLTQESDERWTTTDAEGTLVVLVHSKFYQLRFVPKVRLAIPESVLSAVVSRFGVYLEDGNSFQINLGDKSLMQEGHNGLETEWITFSIAGGYFEGSTISIKWDK
jgi:hypothetical protein